MRLLAGIWRGALEESEVELVRVEEAEEAEASVEVALESCCSFSNLTSEEEESMTMTSIFSVALLCAEVEEVVVPNEEPLLLLFAAAADDEEVDE